MRWLFDLIDGLAGAGGLVGGVDPAVFDAGVESFHVVHHPEDQFHGLRVAGRTRLFSV